MGRKARIPAKKWRNAIMEAQRECKAAGVPYVIVALDPDNNGQAHGGYDGPSSAIAGILAATEDNMKGQLARGTVLFDREGNPIIAGQGGSTEDEVSKQPVRRGGPVRRLVRRWFGREVRTGAV